MFRFESFHMYGIIGTAVITGVILVQFIKRTKHKSVDGLEIFIEEKPKTYKANLLGGIIFGLGWALVGACPGPLYILIGGGFFAVVIVIISALFGTFLYGLWREKLPH